MNALADPSVGKFVNEHFSSSFQKVATFKIVGKAKQGGNVANVARKDLEAKTGKNVVTSLNAKTALQLNEGDKKKEK
ncbi:hypothetical protein [Aquiflexum sp.]|uniref:hypothetical protein n=1 Tax=Aquiflexum sp. TaxID=1872584 RepID=UPI0035940339